jgi:hypothetical protein
MLLNRTLLLLTKRMTPLAACWVMMVIAPLPNLMCKQPMEAWIPRMVLQTKQLQLRLPSFFLLRDAMPWQSNPFGHQAFDVRCLCWILLGRIPSPVLFQQREAMRRRQMLLPRPKHLHQQKTPRLSRKVEVLCLLQGAAAPEGRKIHIVSNVSHS